MARYDLMLVGGHEGKVRVGNVDAIPLDEALEQKTESDWVAVHEVTDDNRAIPSATTKKTAKTPNRNLRNIFQGSHLPHARIDVERRSAPGRD